jgi:hypothetical protein
MWGIDGVKPFVQVELVNAAHGRPSSARFSGAGLMQCVNDPRATARRQARRHWISGFDRVQQH